MNQWPFVLAAYAATSLGTLALLVGSWRAAARAERSADAVAKPR